MIQRTLLSKIVKNQRDGFVTVIYGARRVGKTILLEQLKTKWKDQKALFLNGDVEETRNLLGTTSEIKLERAANGYDVVFVDEAQRIPNIGLSLKILIDKFPKKRFVVTGSSSLELSQGMHENLTGRNFTYKLFPLSTKEISENFEDFKIPSLLEDQLIFGGYPYLRQLNTANEKQKYLSSIVEDYLFRDILLLERIVDSEILKKMATLISFQIGSVVSLNELSRNLGIDVKTVARYLSLLEKSFIIFSVGSFSSNLRKELARSKKYYFYDLGIRNALIGQFLPLNMRGDVGSLWENFLFVERLKKQEYSDQFSQFYFWRNYQKREIDMIEKRNQEIRAFEFKWDKNKFITPKLFLEKYRVKADVVNKDNYLDFVLSK